jgi:uncharacterized protein YprB with RNaseH-like and TPR domain
MHPDLAALTRSFPDSTLFLDLETCGLAGSAIFLVGVIQGTADGLVISQLLARNYAEEKAILCSLWRLIACQSVLVSFNGKSFDWPMVQDRTTLHRLDRSATVDLLHCDLLHHARRRWKGRLRDCKLQTLEQFVCGRRRRGDIPGRDVPRAYHQYVRSGDAWEMRSVLHHNALDLVTLLELSQVLVGGTHGRV